LVLDYLCCDYYDHLFLVTNLESRHETIHYTYKLSEDYCLSHLMYNLKKPLLRFLGLHSFPFIEFRSSFLFSITIDDVVFVVDAGKVKEKVA